MQRSRECILQLATTEARKPWICLTALGIDTNRVRLLKGQRLTVLLFSTNLMHICSSRTAMHTYETELSCNIACELYVVSILYLSGEHCSDGLFCGNHRKCQVCMRQAAGAHRPRAIIPDKYNSRKTMSRAKIGRQLHQVPNFVAQVHQASCHVAMLPCMQHPPQSGHSNLMQCALESRAPHRACRSQLRWGSVCVGSCLLQLLLLFMLCMKSMRCESTRASACARNLQANQSGAAMKEKSSRLSCMCMAVGQRWLEMTRTRHTRKGHPDHIHK